MARADKPELRSSVNHLRQRTVLSPFNCTVDPKPERNVTSVKAEHIRQLQAERSHLGLPTDGYEHPTLTENSSLIYAVDFRSCET